MATTKIPNKYLVDQDIIQLFIAGNDGVLTTDRVGLDARTSFLGMFLHFVSDQITRYYGEGNKNFEAVRLKYKYTGKEKDLVNLMYHTPGITIKNINLSKYPTVKLADTLQVRLPLSLTNILDYEYADRSKRLGLFKHIFAQIINASFRPIDFIGGPLNVIANSNEWTKNGDLLINTWEQIGLISPVWAGLIKSAVRDCIERFASSSDPRGGFLSAKTRVKQEIEEKRTLKLATRDFQHEKEDADIDAKFRKQQMIFGIEHQVKGLERNLENVKNELYLNVDNFAYQIDPNLSGKYLNPNNMKLFLENNDELVDEKVYLKKTIKELNLQLKEMKTEFNKLDKEHSNASNNALVEFKEDIMDPNSKEKKIVAEALGSVLKEESSKK